MTKQKKSHKCRACGKTYTGWYCKCRRKARNAARRKYGGGGSRTVRVRSISMAAVPSSVRDYAISAARAPMLVDEVTGFTADDAVAGLLRRFPNAPDFVVAGLREYAQAHPFTNGDDWYKGAAIATKPKPDMASEAESHLRYAMWVQMDIVRARLARERLRTVRPESVVARLHDVLMDYGLSADDIISTWDEAVQAWDETIACFGTGWGLRWVTAIEKRGKHISSPKEYLGSKLARATADALAFV